jgi:malate dehydrogenase (oxaloacetate-decarboxylating)(NADP+)
LSALRVTRGRLASQRLLCVGAGEAATGICDLFCSDLVAEGLTPAQARDRCLLFDSQGLVVRSRGGALAEHKQPFAHDLPPESDLVAAITTYRPTVLLGASGQPGLFTRAVLEAMAHVNERPVVFALSNPTSKSECTAEQAYSWTWGRALFASGSPFAPVQLEGRTFVPGQGNNAYVFPGIGLGLIASRARRATDEMFTAAAHALAQQVTEDDLRLGRLYPALSRIQEVSQQIACAVARLAWDRGLATGPRPDDLEEHIASFRYRPRYRSYLGGQ